MIRSVRKEGPTTVVVKCDGEDARLLRSILHARIARSPDMFRSQGLYLGIIQDSDGESVRFSHSMNSDLLFGKRLDEDTAHVKKSFNDFYNLIRDYLVGHSLSKMDSDNKRRAKSIDFLRGESPKERTAIIRVMEAQLWR